MPFKLSVAILNCCLLDFLVLSNYIQNFVIFGFFDEINVFQKIIIFSFGNNKAISRIFYFQFCCFGLLASYCLIFSSDTKCQQQTIIHEASKKNILQCLLLLSQKLSFKKCVNQLQ
eukprot:TRINITY_DN2115_c0_g1_i1.p3 TRINITY_DN2115_c0_g1~~TRINITY_DN2115_c0_g1_i1.p3  ORF type:complete len:116 (+),score=0.46 TRINITY_DN2115_c0_g1_i1:482-829(+)